MSSERVWAYAETARVGLRDHLAANPWRLSVLTSWPRGVLQCLLYTLLGAVGTRGGESFAFVGAVALAVAPPASVGVATVLLTDRTMGTYTRLRLGRLPTVVVLGLRSLPWLAEAMITMVLSAVCVGALIGQLPLGVRLLALWPVFLLMVTTSMAAALALTILGVGHDLEIMLGNSLVYLIIAAGGIVGSAARVPWLDDLGAVLPVRNGLLALRALLAGRPWQGHLLAEIAVGAAWAVAAWLAHRWHEKRARHDGRNAFD
ncbi:hypothetical protein AB0P05_11580 [Streptomyces flaveolus]|uniref:hypothetical protein n=1 Tax=Streptomyces flaveolus TaxID=67297 RepID=UPI00343E463B